MYGWAHNCLKEMIIREYGIDVWKEVEITTKNDTSEWNDSKFYPDKAFFDIINAVVTLPDMNSEQVLHLYGNYVLQYLRDKSLEISDKIPLAQSLYDHMVSLAGVYATLGIMSCTFPVKVWCSKDALSSKIFYLYIRVEGEEVAGFSEMIEGTVKAVASQYFGIDVAFDRCVTQGLDGGNFNMWKVTELSNLPQMSTQLKEALKQTHLKLKYGLSPQQLDNVFPFHIIFNSSLNIIQSGEQCLRLIPSAAAGANVADIFSINYVQKSITWEDIQSKMKGDNCQIDDVLNDFCLTTTLYKTPQGHSFGLKGVLTFTLANDIAVFLCCPDVSSLARMEDLGVVMKDLSKQDRIQLQRSVLAETMHGMNLMKGNRAEYAATHLKQALISAEDKLGTKQSFVRYVSHEIRTPLMVVNIGLALLETDLEDVIELFGQEQVAADNIKFPSSVQSDDEPSSSFDNNIWSNLGDRNNRNDGEDGPSILKNALHTIVACKNSMGVAVGILNDLLAYEKVESGILQLNEGPVHGVNLFFKDTVDEFVLQAQEKSIKLDYVNSLPQKLNDVLYLFIDKLKIKQVIRNFMSNALKFTPPHGTITISVKVSHNMGDDKPSDDYENLTDEEAILLVNSRSRHSSDAFANNSCKQFSPTNDEVTAKHMDAADYNEADNGKSDNGAKAEGPKVVDGKVYQTYGKVIVSFVDTGAGIAKENQDKVFKSIVQFKPDELQKGGGSGLGLYLSRGIVKAHGGETGLLSAGEGQGSNFFFSLPLYILNHDENEDVKCGETSSTNNPLEPEANAEQAANGEAKMKVFLGLRILVVEDSTMVRKMLVMMLNRLGSKVQEAGDGQEAIDIIIQKNLAKKEAKATEDSNILETIDKSNDGAKLLPFDLILMDTNLPRVTGPEATEVIVRKLGFSNPVVGVTGSVLPSDVKDFLVHGATAVLPKPLVMEDLADIILKHSAP